MASEKDLKAFEDYCKLLMGPDAKHMKPLLTSKELPYLLHISTNKNIKEFIPSVTRRTLQKEDRRMPRISTCDSLWGCMVGYSAMVADFEQHTLGEDGWCGGYCIYGLPFKVGVVPAKKLLDDVDATDEKWLIGFDEAHRVIKPVKVGKLFLKSMTTDNSYGGKDNGRRYSFELYIQVKEPFHVAPGNLLNVGYYRVRVTDQMSYIYWDKDAIVTQEISRGEFLAAKGVTAGLLSFDTTAPSTSWL